MGVIITLEDFNDTPYWTRSPVSTVIKQLLFVAEEQGVCVCACAYVCVQIEKEIEEKSMRRGEKKTLLKDSSM